MSKSVGYGRPPEHSKWKTGQSGNPKGRPKGSMNITTIITKELGTRVRIVEGGVPKWMTKGEALVKAFIANGIKGDKTAMPLLLRMPDLYPAKDTDKPSDLADIDKKIMDDFLILMTQKETKK